jgi:hypothetical protein
VTPARLLALLATALLASACEAPRTGGGAFDFVLFMNGATSEPVGAYQVSLLTDGRRYDCEALKSTCLNGSVQRDALVPFTDANGREHPAIIVQVTAANDAGTQDVAVSAEVGLDYKMVIEALSARTPTRLVGSSCTPMPDGIHGGKNDSVLAEPFKLFDPSLNCNPRWE